MRSLLTEERARRHGALAAAVLVMAAAGHLPLAAQAPDTVRYRHEGEIIELPIYLDSIGVVAAPGTTEAELQGALDGFGITLARRLSAGVFVAALPTEAADRRSIFTLGRDLYTQRAQFIENAGVVTESTGTAYPRVIADQFIVRYHANSAQASIDSLVAAHTVQLLETNPYDPLLTLYRVTPNSDGDVLEVTEAFWLSPLTEWAYPDFFGDARPTEFVPNDTHFGNQWHLKNAAGTGDIDATLAWDITKGSSSVVIAVTEVDGFEMNHPDLIPNLWVNTAEESGTAMVDDDNNGYVDDVFGFSFLSCVNATTPCNGTDLAGWGKDHGVAVAGLIAAKGNNGMGVSGVCPECRVMLLVVGPGHWRRSSAFLYAEANGASIINASWSMVPDNAVTQDVKSVTTNGRGGKGIPFVGSAGNWDFEVCNPPGHETYASLDEVISVSSSDNNDVRVLGTGYGDCLDLLAPGGFGGTPSGITTLDELGTGGYNDGVVPPPPNECTSRPELTDAGYTNCFGGTSAATAQVSGVVGLMLSVNPNLTRAQVREVLIETADKIDCAAALYGGSAACPSNALARSDTHGYGRVNAFAAVQRARQLVSTACGGSPCPVVTTGPKVELGARAGITQMSGMSNPDVRNAPGGGPAGEPAFHLTWLSGSSATAAGQWMVESQLGLRFQSTSNPPLDESNVVLAAQLAYLFAASGTGWYVGANAAAQRITSGATTTTDWAPGVAVGYRVLPKSFFALRAEVRYRHWSSRNIDEVGLALGFGVVLP